MSALQTLISLAETVLAVDGVLSKEEVPIALIDDNGKEYRSFKDWYKKGRYEARQEILMAISGKLDGLK